MYKADLYVNSELVSGALMHPTLPMSYLGEIIELNGENYTATYTINFTTKNTYTDPFFIMTFANGTGRFFYYHVAGSGNSFSITFERIFSLMEGRYRYYSGERNGNITLPMFIDGKLYVGGSRG